jgi:hypothetical protein
MEVKAAAPSTIVKKAGSRTGRLLCGIEDGSMPLYDHSSGAAFGHFLTLLKNNHRTDEKKYVQGIEAVEKLLESPLGPRTS